MAGRKIDGKLIIRGDNNDYVLIRRYKVVNGARVFTSMTKIFFNTGDIKTTNEIHELQEFI